MVGLLDVNALVALFDPGHVHHSATHGWFALSRNEGWATCPITENGLVRVASHPSYAGRRTTVAAAIDLFRRFRESGDHEFWPDSISICEPERYRLRHLIGHNQLTDMYLLALAVARGGCLVTLDRGIAVDAVAGAEARHLRVISPV